VIRGWQAETVFGDTIALFEYSNISAISVQKKSNYVYLFIVKASSAAFLDKVHSNRRSVHVPLSSATRLCARLNFISHLSMAHILEFQDLVSRESKFIKFSTSNKYHSRKHT
jgi:hypothetical protein